MPTPNTLVTVCMSHAHGKATTSLLHFQIDRHVQTYCVLSKDLRGLPSQSAEEVHDAQTDGDDALHTFALAMPSHSSGRAGFAV